MHHCKRLNIALKPWPMVAIETATEAVGLDNLRERAYQLLMSAYSATSNREKALEVYHQLRQLLDDELGAQPSPATEAIYLELLG